MGGRILVVDDEPLKRITLQIELSEHGYEVYEAADARTARRIFDGKPIDVVVSDVRMPGMSGLDLLAYIKQNKPEVEVILMTAYATVDTAVSAIKRGAYDYITKPFTTQELLRKLKRLFASHRAAADDGATETFGPLIAANAGMKRLFERLRRVADTERAILLCGESGTGKALLARAVHEHSSRAGRALLRIDCAVQKPDALERALFGQEPDASAGVQRPKPGRLEQADGGTVLLDDVDRIPADLQIKLLRVIEQRAFERAGGNAPIKVDVRFVCTTECDLAKLVENGAFRKELYYRLNVINLLIPSLRDRPEDIPVLANHFLRKHAQPDGDASTTIAPHALDELLRYHWPGNVRELEHVIERALAFCGDDDEIRPEHVLPLARDADVEAGVLEAAPLASGGLTETVFDIERRLILMALRQCNGNQVRAAHKLGIPRTTLRDKMAKYSIPVQSAEC